MATLALVLSPPIGARSILLVALVVIWAARLSTFLFRRVVRAGKDDRFDEIKASFLSFLSAWNTQGLWISFTLAAALAAVTSTRAGDIDAFAVVGLLIWIVGFSIEAVADAQKRRFRADPANKGRYIRTGLWSWSRHPNYFGEITLWTGVAIIALPALQGWQWVTLISPVFVFLLITRVSGVPILEKRADAKWSGEADYRAYRSRTSVLVPLPPRADAK